MNQTAQTGGALPQITVEDLKQRLDAGNSPVILDVRKPDEYAICKLPNSILIPLSELPSRLQELNPDVEMVVHCKLGGRSSQAVAFLREHGFANVKNLTGGIQAWAERVEPSMPKY